MSGSDELYPPAQYGWGWMLLALGILALLVLAAWLVIALTRPRRLIDAASASHAPIPSADVLAVLREEYLARIAHIETEYAARRMDPRRANLELSRTVRAFVNEYSGIEAPVLALDDLVALGVHPALIDALHRHYYPSVFRRGPAIDPIAGIAAARKVVTTWN
ncbi:hypothetical protein ACWGJP_05280 [Microbacterium sp. NPDC055903]